MSKGVLLKWSRANLAAAARWTFSVFVGQASLLQAFQPTEM